MTLTKKIILFLTTCMVALPFGGAVFSFIAPWEYDVSAATFLDWHKHIDSYMASRGAFIGLPTPALLLIQTIIFWRDGETPKAGLVLIALLLNIAGIVIAFTGNVPINQQLQALTPGTIPPDWETIRNAWLGFHFWRNVTAIIGFGSFMMVYFVREK